MKTKTKTLLIMNMISCSETLSAFLTWYADGAIILWFTVNVYLPNVSPFCAVKHQLSAILTPRNRISDRIQSPGLIDVKPTGGDMRDTVQYVRESSVSFFIL